MIDNDNFLIIYFFFFKKLFIILYIDLRSDYAVLIAFLMKYFGHLPKYGLVKFIKSPYCIVYRLFCDV